MAKKEKKSVITKTVYHGGIETEINSGFKSTLWFTEDFDYAYGFGPNIICAKINIYNPFKVGNTDAYVKFLGIRFTTEFEELADKLEMSPQDLLNIYDGDKTDCKKIFNLVRTEAFRRLVESKGYDGIFTIEESTHNCWGVFHSTQVKVISVDSEDETEWIEKEDRTPKFKTPNELTEEWVEIDRNDTVKTKVLLTTSPYEVKSVMLKSENPLRILYDKNINMYMLGNAYDLIHHDLIVAAVEQGYYYDVFNKYGYDEAYFDDFSNDELIWDYQEDADEGGKLVYMVFGEEDTDIDESELGEDYYVYKYVYNFGVIVTRDTKLSTCSLYQVLGKPEAQYELEKDDYGGWLYHDGAVFKVPIDENYIENKLNYLLENTDMICNESFSQGNEIATLKNGETFNIWTECDGGYYGQSNWFKIAYTGDNWIGDDDKPIKENLLGLIEFATYGGDIYIQMIQTKKDRKREGIATALIKSLYKDADGKRIHWGFTTDEGTELRKALLNKGIIKEEYIEYNTPQRERSGLASTNILITLSPYEVKSKLLSSKKPLRILYDSSKGKKLYMVGDAEDIIHYNMLEAALENGYYDFDKWDIDSYIDDGLDNDTLYYALYTPKGEENNSYGYNLGEDDYDEKYDYDFGTITTRTSNWKKVPLSKVLGNYNEHTQLGWKKDNWGEWVKDIQVVEELEETLTDDEKKKLDAIDNFIDKLYGLRQESIQTDGEFGIGNLVFKEFRNLGYLEYLKELKNQLESKNLSLEGLKESVSADNINNILTVDSFRKIAKQYIVEDPSKVKKGYIDTNGDIYDIYPIADVHMVFLYDIYSQIYYDKTHKDFNDEVAEYFEDSDMLATIIEDEWGFIRCSTDLGGYVAISNNPTDEQYKTLLSWLYGIMERGSESVEVSLFTNDWTGHRYYFSENYLPEDIIKSIKKAIATKSPLLESKEDNEKFRRWLNDDETFNKFMSNKQRLKDLGYAYDIYQLMKSSTPDKVKDMVNKLEEIPSKTQREKSARAGANLLYDKNGLKVYEITTYEASCKYGRNTEWCITGIWDDSVEYWDGEVESGAKIYFFITKNPQVIEQEKVALIVGKNYFWVYDELDYYLPCINNFPTELTNTIGVDASKPEKSDLANFNKIGIDWNQVDYVEANYSEYFEDQYQEKPVNVHFKNGEERIVIYWWDANRVKDVTEDFNTWYAEEDE